MNPQLDILIAKVLSSKDNYDTYREYIGYDLISDEINELLEKYCGE